MPWHKFIGGMAAFQIEDPGSLFPEPCPQMGVAAFPDGAGHPALLGRAKGMAPERGEHVQFQQKIAL